MVCISRYKWVIYSVATIAIVIRYIMTPLCVVNQLDDSRNKLFSESSLLLVLFFALNGNFLN